MDHDGKLDLKQAISTYRRNALISIQSAYCIGALALLFLIHASAPVLGAIATSAGLSAVSIVFALRKRLLPSALILGFQFLVLPTYAACKALGTYDSAVLVFPAGMMALATVTRPRYTALFFILTLACFGVVTYFTLQGTNGNPVFYSMVQRNPADILTSLTIIGFSGIVATYVSYILSSLLQKLASYQATLEERIARRTGELAQSNDELRAAIHTLDQARAELVRGEKLAGLGSLVAGVSHELNTPIGNSAMAATTLLHHVEGFRRDLAAGPLKRTALESFLATCQEGAELIVKATHRARDLVASFKQVAVDQTSDRRRAFELNELVSDVVRSMRPSFAGHDWTIEIDADGSIACDGYPGTLVQVLTNLVQNAIFHGFRERERGLVRIVTRTLEGGQCSIAVSDDGHGIADDVIGRIYDPFYTTRLGHGGSGLGLTIAHNLVTVVLGGQIEVQSRLNEGTVFRITLPRSAPLGK